MQSVTLANKYRPKTFNDVVEQDLVTTILKNICSCQELSNRNFLLTGPAGTGKTTLARIIGNSLNGADCEPIEIDAASNSGVDAMRDIVQQARSYPIKDKYKIFIIDEAHALSSAAWQSLLKVLEESPAKSVFIFCTTNPEKIPKTILSRVQTFQLSKISLEGIYNRLIYILQEEIKSGNKIEFDSESIMFVAKLANGGLRDALTLLDKVLAYSDNINNTTVMKSLNLPNYDDFFSLLSAITKKDNTRITEIVNNVYNSGVNFTKWFEDFHAFVINIVKYIFLKDIDKTMIPNQYLDKISKYESQHAYVCLGLANQLLNLNRELRSTNYQQEMALTYLCRIPKTK